MIAQMHKPKGYLVIVGGGENKGTDEQNNRQDNYLNSFEMGVLSQVLKLVEEGTEPVVEVVTSASKIPEDMAQMYFDAFNKLGCKNVGHLDIRKREDTENKQYLDRLIHCNCILFSGGDQLRLSSIFGGTEFLDILKERYRNETFIIAGTSAGAMAMSNTMIFGGNACHAHLKGEVKMSIGFGFLQNVIIDTHFDKRGRFNRLAQSVASQPGIIGIGLGEDTGLIVSEGDHLTAIGSGSITVIDGKKIRYNNIADISTGMPISVENLVVHIMSNADVYNLSSRHYIGNEFRNTIKKLEKHN